MRRGGLAELDRDDWPTAADTADDRPRTPPAPGPYRCDDPWCADRQITPDQVDEHATAGCTACATGALCLVLELEAQQDHLHGTTPPTTRSTP